MAVTCLICNAALETELEPELAARGSPAGTIGIVHGGLVCRTTGNYGSTVFDPMGPDFLEFVVCDDCLAARAAGVVAVADPAAPRATGRVPWVPPQRLDYPPDGEE